MWLKKLAVCSPIMGILVLIKRTITIPVLKSMSALGRSIGIPTGLILVDIRTWCLGIVGNRMVSMQFTKIGTTIARLVKNIADAFHIISQIGYGSGGIAIETHTTLIGIKPSKQHTTMGTADRAVAHGGRKNHGLGRKTIKIRRIGRIRTPIDMWSIHTVLPETHGCIAQLVRKDINHIGAFGYQG